MTEHSKESSAGRAPVAWGNVESNYCTGDADIANRVAGLTAFYAAPANATAASVQLFRQALAWGKVYGAHIPAAQWDAMRDAQATQLAGRAVVEPDLIDVTPGSKEDIAYACRPNFYDGPGLTYDRLTQMRAYIEKRISESCNEVPFTINSETLLELIDTIQHHEYVPRMKPDVGGGKQQILDADMVERLFTKHGVHVESEGWCVNRSGLTDFLLEYLVAITEPLSNHERVELYELREAAPGKVAPSAGCRSEAAAVYQILESIEGAWTDCDKKTHDATDGAFCRILYTAPRAECAPREALDAELGAYVRRLHGMLGRSPEAFFDNIDNAIIEQAAKEQK